MVAIGGITDIARATLMTAVTRRAVSTRTDRMELPLGSLCRISGSQGTGGLLSGSPHMERAFPNPVGEILNDERKRGFFEGGLRDCFPACHDHSSRIDQLLLQLQRNELDQGAEQGACVLLAGS